MAVNIEEKYAQERQKRINPEGTAQYINVRSPEIEELGKDPWVDYEALAKTDPPLRDGGKIKVLITGAGHNGILFAARLIEAGFDPKDIVLVDIAGGYGGTWYWNRYPGLMCDVEGYCYLPLLQETGYVPKHKYSYGAEIRHNTELIATRYGLQGMFCTKVDRQEWDDTKGCWTFNLTQSLGSIRPPTKLTVQAQFVFMAGGVLSIPKIPKVPGFSDFRKDHQIFHTSRWDYNITGGSQEQPDMTKLKDKVVAIIGTGATSVQAVPQLAKWAKHLFVVQRTPSYCGERGQKETTPEDWAKVTDGPGWQTRRCKNLNSYLSANPEPVDLVNDGWSKNQARAGLIGGNGWPVDPRAPGEHIKKLMDMDRPIAEELRSRIDDVVKDANVAEKLKPWYSGWCKRPTFNDDYLEAFNRNNVTLLDTDGKGITGYTERGIVIGEQEFDVDVLILGTGFTPSLDLGPSGRQDAPIIGRGGRLVDDKCSSTDCGTLMGVATHDYPNMFALYGSGIPASYNMTSAYDVAARLTAYILAEASRQSSHPEHLVIEPSMEGEEKWTNEVAMRAGWYAALATCTPSYFTSEGMKTAPPASMEEAMANARKAGWGTGILDYQRIVEDYIARTDNKLEGFLISEASV
jgi:cation diffusion facilitator CzcD-associated flavoprotein CzcO